MIYTRQALYYIIKFINLRYIFYWLGSILTMILCYLTNPIVVLFCDKYGNLPKVFKLWQTYDNCLDIDWMIYENKVPSIFRYDFNKHYKYHPEVKEDNNLIPGHVEILDDNFTIKEIIQRYFCRVLWLYRNCAYGFAYYWFGINHIGHKQNIIISESNENHEKIYVSTYSDISGKYFCVKSTEYWKLFGHPFKFDIYIGWKMAGTSNYKTFSSAMTAIRINPFQKADID